MNREVWKDVVGYEGVYQVSSLGRVKRVAGGMGATPGRILKPHRRPDGYLTANLCRDGKPKQVRIHRLVAERFLGPAPSPRHEVNHKNGDKTDNRVENLEWVTRSENHTHAYRQLGRQAAPTKGEASNLSKLTRRDVVEIRKLWATGKYTLAELGEMFGVSKSNISMIVNRKTWQHVP